MPGIKTLTDLTTQVRRRARMEGSQLCSDSEIQQYIQDSWGEYWDLLIEYMPQDHFVEDAEPISTVAGTAQYAILSAVATNARPYKILGVDLVLSGVVHHLSPSSSMPMKALSADTINSPTGRPTEYALYGPVYLSTGGTSNELRGLALWPIPDAVYTVLVYYIPMPPDLTANSDNNMFSFSGWDEFIICDAAAKCLEKEESYEAADRLLRRKAATEQRLRFHLMTMSSDGHRVSDVDDRSTPNLRGEPW